MFNSKRIEALEVRVVDLELLLERLENKFKLEVDIRQAIENTFVRKADILVKSGKLNKNKKLKKYN